MKDYGLPDKAKNNNPRAPLEWMEEHYPELTEKIKEANEQGKAYDEADCNWKIEKTERWGLTVYQNPKQVDKSSGSGGKSYFREKAKDTKQQQLSQTEQRAPSAGQIDATDTIAYLATQIKMQNVIKIFELAREDGSGRSYEQIFAEMKTILEMMG